MKKIIITRITCILIFIQFLTSVVHSQESNWSRTESQLSSQGTLEINQEKVLTDQSHKIKRKGDEIFTDQSHKIRGEREKNIY